MDASDSTTTAVVIALSVLLLVLYLFQTWKTRHNSQTSTAKYDIELPPLAYETFPEMLEAFISPTAPQMVVAKAREMNVSIFRGPKLPLPFQPFVFFLTDHESARKILEDPESKKFDQGNEIFFEITKGTNFLYAQDHRWKHVRKHTSPAFSSKNIELMVKTIGSVVDTWIGEVLEPSIKVGKDIDILREANRITASVISKAAFDYDIPHSEREQFLDDVLLFWTVFATKVPKNMLKQFKITQWAFSDVRQAKQASQRIISLCEKILQAYRAKSEKQPHKVIHMIMEDPDYENDTERVRDLVMYAIGGFDTTSNAIAFALRELAMNPMEQTKLRKVLQECQSDEEARHCPALKHVVKETLRLDPPVYGSARMSGRDYIFENYHGDKGSTKTLVPKGSLCITHSYAIQRDGRVFKDPDSFNPSRWTSPSREMMKSYFTFSLGKRNCQGQALAYAEMYEVIFRLCRKYEFGIVEEGKAQNVMMYKPVGTILSAKIAPN